MDYEYENNKLINGSIVGGVRVKNIKRYDIRIIGIPGGNFVTSMMIKIRVFITLRLPKL